MNLQNRKRLADLENELMVAGVQTEGQGWGEGKVREFGMDRYTLLYLRWITNKDLLWRTWNLAQCYIAAWIGIYVYVWLSPFTVHLKLHNSDNGYNLIQNKKFKNIYCISCE